MNEMPEDNSIMTVLKGGAIGIANIIPGVSGGTMAVVLGIYTKLITAISRFFTDRENRKSDFFFLLKIALGVLLALLLLVNVIDYALTHHRALTMIFFMGLILGSMPSIFKMQPRQTYSVSLMCFVGAGIILVMFLGGGGTAERPQTTEMQTAVAALQLVKLFIAGILAGGAMIVPGVSGSFILLVLGEYQTIIRLIKALMQTVKKMPHVSLALAAPLLPLSVFAVGVVCGILLFAKLIEMALRHFAAQTYAFILGLIGASFFVLYQGVPPGLLNGLLTVVLFFAGLLAALYLSPPPQDICEP